MNPRNPIDDLFRRRLEDHEPEHPMHLWADIDRRRNWQHRMRLQARRQKPVLLLMLFLLGGSLSGILLWPDKSPILRSFPIPVTGAHAPMAGQFKHPPLPELPPLPPIPAASEIRTKQSARLPEPVRALVGSTEMPAADPARLPIQASTFLSVLPDAPAAAPPRPAKERFFGAASLPKIVMTPLPRDPQCVRFGQYRRWRIYADMHIGPALHNRQLKADSPEYENYAGARRKTETPQMSLTAAARISVVSDFGLALRSGVQFTQYNEHFDFTDNSQEKITITNVYGSNGEIIGTDTLVEMGTLRAMASNHYRILDIPLLLGYEWHNEKWTVAFNGGALLNVLFDARGDFLSPDDLTPVDFSSSDSSTFPAYRRDIGLGWYAGIGLHYKLQEDLQLLLEPHFRINPQSITRDAYVLSQRYMSAGLSVGLRKQL